MAYPSLEELLKAYQTGNPGAGPALQSAQEGLKTGISLQEQMANTAALREYRKQRLMDEMSKLKQSGTLGQERVDIDKEKAETPKDKWKTVGQTPEGYLIQENASSGEQRISPIKASPGLGKGLNNYADVRLKRDLSTQLLGDPNYRKNQDIIDRGLRVENISDSRNDVVKNPTSLHILNDLIVAQAEGGKASLAGVSKVGNETAPQFAARVMEKIVNEPVDARANDFIKQIKDISHQDIKSAYTSIDALARAKGNGLKRLYPGHETDIDSVSNNFANDYVSGVFGGKKPEFLSGGGATGQIDEETPKSPSSTTPSKNPLIDAFNKL